MRALKRTFRQRRTLGLEQLTGFTMLGAALLLYLRPRSLTFDWFERLFTLPHGVMAALGIVLMLAFGISLVLRASTSSRTFLIHTTPIVGFAVLTTTYSLISNSASILPGYFAFVLWVGLQVAHDLTEVLKQWTPSSNPSSLS